MNPRMRFDLRPIQRGIKALAPQMKKSRRELAEEAARGFVKEVVAITPPASKGKRGSAAKKAGEGAIIADLARVMVAAARRKGVKLGDPAEIHKRLRDPHTGRINPRNLQHPYPVDASALRALKRDLLKRVGELAAGWNAGAQKLYDRCIQGGNCPFEDEIIVQVGKKRRPAVCLRPERAGT